MPPARAVHLDVLVSHGLAQSQAPAAGGHQVLTAVQSQDAACVRCQCWACFHALHGVGQRQLHLPPAESAQLTGPRTAPCPAFRLLCKACRCCWPCMSERECTPVMQPLRQKGSEYAGPLSAAVTTLLAMKFCAGAPLRDSTSPADMFLCRSHLSCGSGYGNQPSASRCLHHADALQTCACLHIHTAIGPYIAVCSLFSIAAGRRPGHCCCTLDM